MLEAIEIAAILPRIDDLIAWANDIKDFALQQALSGTEYEGFKVVERHFLCQHLAQGRSLFAHGKQNTCYLQIRIDSSLNLRDSTQEIL